MGADLGRIVMFDPMIVRFGARVINRRFGRSIITKHYNCVKVWSSRNSEWRPAYVASQLVFAVYLTTREESAAIVIYLQSYRSEARGWIVD